MVFFLVLVNLKKIEIYHGFKKDHDNKKEEGYNLVPHTFDWNTISDKEQFDEESESDNVKKQVDSEVSFSGQSLPNDTLSFWGNVLSKHLNTFLIVCK